MDDSQPLRPATPRRSRSVSEAEARMDLGVAFLLGASAFLVYLWSIMPGAFPGDPASLVARAVGVKPQLSAEHAVWAWLASFVAGFRQDNIVFRVNFLSAVCGALSVGLLYLVVTRLLSQVIDETLSGRLPPARRALGAAVVRRAVLLGGVCASLALAYCIPFWIASTQSYYHTLYVAWLLGSVLLLLQYIRTGRIGWAILFSSVHAAGMTQASAFIAFAPLLGAALLFMLWRKDDFDLRSLLPIVLAGFAGGCLIFFNAGVFFRSEGFELMGYGGFFQVVRLLVNSLRAGITGSLPRVGWMIIVGLTIAPWMAAMVASFRALNEERDWSFYALHAAIATVTVAVLIDIKASPWRFMGVSDATIIPYVLTSMTFGYLAAYLLLLVTHALDIPDVPRKWRLARILRTAVMVVFPLFAVVAALLNFRETDHRRTRFIALYADRLLDNLAGRSWLVTNGVLDDVLLLRAKERGIPLRCISLADNSSDVAIRYFKRHIDNIRLKNTADLGFVSMLQEWITSEPSAGTDLALALVPDLWGTGDYEVQPNGLVFLGVKDEEFKAQQVPALLERHNALWDEMEQALAAVPESASDRIQFYRDRIVRPQVSFIGNNLGYMLETMGKNKESFAVYDRMHAFDPDNVSALLNWATMVFNGQAPEKKDAVVRDLDALNRKLDGSQLPIWSLARVFGYVSRPETFAQLGWSWASSGQPNLALRALSRAEESTPPEHRAAIRASMAHIHMLRDRPEESERVYFEMLVEDAANREALMGLVRIFTLRGDVARAREFLQRAEKAGVPKSQLLVSTAMITHAEGNTAVARAILQEQIDLDPKNVQAMAILCALLVQERDVKGLEAAIGKLELAAGPDSYQVLIARGSLAELVGDRRAARDHFLRAYRFMPNAVALLDRILKLDFQLADKIAAAEHAKTMLRLDLRNSFANYLMGSLASERRDYAAAEDFLRVSVASEATVANLNDLADVLVRRKQIEEAELRVNQAFKLDDQRYEAWDTYGQILMEKGQLDDAETALTTALKLFADDLRVHVHLAHLYFRKGDNPRAAEILRTVAKEAESLPREEWERFEDLHLKVLGVKYAKKR